MGWKEINIRKYIGEIKKNLNLSIADEIIEKDLLLTLILGEFEKTGLGKELVFKGGTLLSRNYLKYHRFSEDLDFVHKDSDLLSSLTRNQREKKIKQFVDIFAPKLKEISDKLNLDFSAERKNQRYCSILSGRTVYTFRIYYSKEKYIKVEINFIEKTINKPIELLINAITDFFDSKDVLFSLNLKKENFRVLSYSLPEIILEKYRAVLTRNKLMERDLFDLFLIPNSLNVNIEQVVEKIKSSGLIKKHLSSLLKLKLNELKEEKFFASTEKIEDLAIVKYDLVEFSNFKDKIKPILIDICEKFLKNNS
jgi:predicted nucleotidyltransferase component of viral defense system